jgi:predicted component of type VI protein secretion system
MEKHYTLIVSIPDSTALSYELKGDRIGLGREADNQISIPISQLSSNHCEFRRTASGYEIIDLNSTNGTRVNGKKFAVHPLADGDRLLLGETLPAHFVELADGEQRGDATIAGDDEQNKAATSYATMDEKLQAIEASITARQSEFDALEASLKTLEEQIAAKKQESGADSEEVRELEKTLMLQTKRIKVMKMDIDQQRANLQQRPATQDTPIHIQPLAPAPVPIAVAVADTPARIPVAVVTQQLLPPPPKAGQPKSKSTIKLNFGKKL